MEKFLEAAAIAWNPVGEVRRRVESATLTVGSVLVPFVGIVITCNLAVLGAQEFFFDAVLRQAGAALPDHPLITSDFAQRLMSALGVLVPIGAVSLLPERAFHPAGRSATIAAILVVAAAWAFYGAAIGIPIYFVAGALATVNLHLALNIYSVLIVGASIAIVGLTLFFWLRISLSVLELSGAQVFGISLTALIAGALVAGFLWFVAQGATMEPEVGTSVIVPGVSHPYPETGAEELEVRQPSQNDDTAWDPFEWEEATEPTNVPDISGQWQGAQGISYFIVQQGRGFTIQEVTLFVGITAQGEGTVGDQVSFSARTFLGTTGRAQLQLSPDGRQMSGYFVDETFGGSVPLVLRR